MCFGPDAGSVSGALVQDTVLSAHPTIAKAWGGEKFPGGYGPTELMLPDYATQRARSSALFRSNLYARGLLRRLVENIIATGLMVEASPIEAILGKEEDSLADWSDAIEDRFGLWARTPRQCDYLGISTFGALQASALLEALIEGDALVVLRQDPVLQTPRVQLLSASRVCDPPGYVQSLGKPEIVYGVELDSDRKHVAYHVEQDDGSSRRLPAYDAAGRRIAWLVYALDKRVEDVRGEPLLTIILQSLREIDRYRDSVQRKATLGANLAIYVKKEQESLGTRSMASAAVGFNTRKMTDNSGVEREYKTAEMIPGVVIDHLSPGEEPKAFPSTGTDEKFDEFQRAILSGIAWANGCPPEILWLAFTNNYSASQAAINEFKLKLTIERTNFGSSFCQLVYHDWLLSKVLLRAVDAPGLLQAFKDPRQAEVLSAWVNAEWTGQIKPSTDIVKQAKGFELAIASGLTTRDRAAREFGGQRFRRVAKKLARENEMLAEANASLAPQVTDTSESEVDSDEDERRVG